MHSNLQLHDGHLLSNIDKKKRSFLVKRLTNGRTGHISMQSTIVTSALRTTVVLHDITYVRLCPRSKHYEMSTRTNSYPRTLKRLTAGGGAFKCTCSIFLQFPSDFAHNSIGHRTPGKTFKLRDNVKFWSCCPLSKHTLPGAHPLLNERAEMRGDNLRVKASLHNYRS